MDLRQDQCSHHHTITHYDPGTSFRLGSELYKQSLIITADKVIAWPPRQLAEIQDKDWAKLWALPEQIIIWGCGAEFALPSANLRQLCAQHKRNLEHMSTQAACGTFNMLLADQRDVVGVFLIG